MKMYKRLAIFFVAIYSSNSCCLEFSDTPVVYLSDLVKAHPFVSALVAVLLLNEDPVESLKEIVAYLVDEHPFVCALALGLLLSGSGDDLSHLAQVGSAIVKYVFKGLSVATRITDKFY